MNMRMPDSLSGGLADVDAYIKPVWASLFLEEFLASED